MKGQFLSPKTREENKSAKNVPVSAAAAIFFERLSNMACGVTAAVVPFTACTLTYTHAECIQIY